MGRIAWALVLAFAAHLVLFLLPISESEEPQLTLAGSAQVSVRIVHSRPEEVDRVVPEPVLESEPEVMEEPEETAESPLRQPEEKVSRQETEGETVVKKIATVVNKGQPAVSESIPTTEEKKTQIVEAALSVPLTDEAESAESGSLGPQAILQAEPLVSFNRPPDYPKLARRRGWQGTVVLEVDVDRDGRVQAVRVQAGSSHSLLDREAMEAVRKWRFTPGSKNGTPVVSKVLVPVHFVLEEN